MSQDAATPQVDFWKGLFGKEYTDRNTRTDQEWDQFYTDTYGHTKLAMNERALGHLAKDMKLLEVGCNVGLQLRGLQRQAYSHLYGVELQQYAVESAKAQTQAINIIQGSGFDLPWRDAWFDVVCTNGVLIHIAPADLPRFIAEMYRCSARYIWGFEYFAEELTEINYRGNTGYLWKADYARLFMRQFPDLKLVSQTHYPHLADGRNVDCMYLLEKVG
ncbi:MAG: pseudaminic acid biosynthesis-associated methylase [Flavobacteriales bacterium]